MRYLGALLLVGWLTSISWAQTEYKALFKEKWGGVYCTGDCQQVPDKTGKRTLLRTKAGPVTITPQSTGYVIQFPRSSASVLMQVDGSLRVRFGPATYTFKQTSTDFEVKMPGDKVTYQLVYGRLTGIRGKAGSVEIRTTFATKTYTIFGPNGTTRLQLTPTKKGKPMLVTLLEGEPLNQIPYLARGYRFEDPVTGVGVFVAIPGGILTQSMGWSAAPTYKPPVPNPVVEQTSGLSKDPLEALPPMPGDPLKAVVGPGGDGDPLKVRLPGKGEEPLKMHDTPKGEDHLKANLGNPAEDPLLIRQDQVKAQKPKKPAANTTVDPAEEDLIVKPGQVVPTQP